MDTEHFLRDNRHLYYLELVGEKPLAIMLRRGQARFIVQISATPNREDLQNYVIDRWRTRRDHQFMIDAILTAAGPTFNHIIRQLHAQSADKSHPPSSYTLHSLVYPENYSFNMATFNGRLKLINMDQSPALMEAIREFKTLWNLEIPNIYLNYLPRYGLKEIRVFKRLSENGDIVQVTLADKEIDEVGNEENDEAVVSEEGDRDDQVMLCKLALGHYDESKKVQTELMTRLIIERDLGEDPPYVPSPQGWSKVRGLVYRQKDELVGFIRDIQPDATAPPTPPTAPDSIPNSDESWIGIDLFPQTTWEE